MSVVGVTLKFAGLTGRDDVTGTREYSKQYVVQTDSAHDGPLTVKNADYGGVRIERYGEFYRTDNESDTQAFVTDRQADPLTDESSNFYLVTVTFSTDVYNGAGNPNAVAVLPQPTDANPEFEWDFQEVTRAAYVHYEGSSDRPRPVVNSALDFYDPPLEYQHSLLVLRFTRNQVSYDPILAARYANKLNSDSWYGFPPYSVLMKPIRGRLAVEQGIGFWKVSYELHFNFDGWYEIVWDKGMREYFTESEAERFNRDIEVLDLKIAKVKAGYNLIQLADGTYVTEPVLLNGRGQRLIAPNHEGKRLDPKEMQFYFHRFRVYQALPFTPLGII